MRITKDQKKSNIRQFYIKHDIYSVDDVKSKHRGHFFDKSAMRFFNSRLIGEVFCGINNCYFVTSEQYDHKSPRLFTLRKFNPETRNVDTIGDFQAYTTRTQALSAAISAAFDESSEFINIK